MGTYKKVNKSTSQPSKLSQTPSPLQRNSLPSVAQQGNGQTLEEMQEMRERFEAAGSTFLLSDTYDSPAQPEAIQAKLTIGEVGDQYEQEADAVAADVVKKINAPPSPSDVGGNNLQRQEIPEEELQMKPTLQRDGGVGGGAASEELEQNIESAKGGGQSLDPNLQTKMGDAMGADFSGVKIHTDAASDQLNRSIQAKAFATGQDVFFRQGAYSPQSESGQELIAHELTHVVQQGGAGVQAKPAVQAKTLSPGISLKQGGRANLKSISRQVDSLSPQNKAAITTASTATLQRDVDHQVSPIITQGLAPADPQVAPVDLEQPSPVNPEVSPIITQGLAPADPQAPSAVDPQAPLVADPQAAAPAANASNSLSLLTGDPQFALAIHKAKKGDPPPKDWPKTQKALNIWKQLSAEAKAKDEASLFEASALKVFKTMYDTAMAEPQAEQSADGPVKKGLKFVGNLFFKFLKKAFYDPIAYWTKGLVKEGYGLRKDMAAVKQNFSNAWTYGKGREVLKGVKGIIGAIGKVAGGMALLTGLLGLIPGLQPILGFTAVAGTLAMWAAMINGSISAIETIYDGAIAAYEKVKDGEVSADRMQSLKLSALGTIQGGVAFATFGLYQFAGGFSDGFLSDPVSRADGAFNDKLPNVADNQGYVDSATSPNTDAISQGATATAERATRGGVVGPGGAEAQGKIKAQHTAQQDTQFLKSCQAQLSSIQERVLGVSLTTSQTVSERRNQANAPVNLTQVAQDVESEFGDQVAQEAGGPVEFNEVDASNAVSEVKGKTEKVQGVAESIVTTAPLSESADE